VVERVYFLGGKGEGARPFHASLDPDAARKPDPYRNHRLGAIGCAAAGILYMLGGYLYERQLWNPAYQAVLQYPDATTPDHERALRKQIKRFTERRDIRRPMRYLPSFFSKEEETLDQLLSQAIRTHHLLPGLGHALASDRPHRRSLYFLALLYATRDNSLGKRILEDSSPHWVNATGLEQDVITTYVDITLEPYGLKPPLEHLPTQLVPDATNDAQQWVLFFQRLERTFAGGSLSPDELSRLRQEADALLKALAIIQQYKESPVLLRELEEATHFGLPAIYEPALAAVKASALFGDGMPTVERLLKLVRGGALSGAEAEVRLLSDFNGRARLLLDGQPGEAGETFRFQVGAQLFTFESQKWDHVIRASATRELVRRFTDGRASRPSSIFFHGTERLSPLVMNPLSDGTFLFTGRAELDGRFTRVAFDEYVRPVLTDFTTLAARLGRDERTAVEQFVASEVRKYANSYVSAVDTYYHAFGVRADSRDSLQILLKQMLGPGSPFTEMLHAVRDNTRVELDEKAVPLFSPMKLALAKYAPLHKVLAEQESGASEFENYRAILEQLRQSLALEGAAALDGARPEEPKPEEKKDAAAAEAEGLQRLPDLLSPAGRMSLAILHRQKGSYEDLVVTWLTSVKLHGELSGPFLAPVQALHALGRKEIEETVARLWSERISSELSNVLRSFPFDPDSRQDVRPEELTALFHPQTGRFHQLTRRFIEPISTRTVVGWRKLDTGNRRLSVPPDLYETLNNVDVLTRRLWDSEGNPRPLRLTVGSVPFKSSASANSILTLVYLNSGTSSLLNFNQQPLSKPLEIDWTRPRQARLSIETIAPDSGTKTYPPAILSEISPWSLLHLLKRASRQEDLWAWTFDLGPEQQGRNDNPKMTVKFQLQDDPWSLFVLRPKELPASPASADTSQP
jgi:type VI secretion system protein ImpL